MAKTYTYRVRDRSGSLRNGELLADSQELVLARLRELDYIPLQIKVKREGMSREINLRQKVKLKDLALFSRQFATMINSGLPLLRSLAILEEQTQSSQLTKVIADVRVEVEQGTALSAAMGKHPKAFPALYVAMCRAGETSGTLDQVLLRLAETLEREVSLRQRIKSAMTYPIVVLGLVVIILTAMLVFVVPQFEDLFADLGGVLPLPTRLLLKVSDIVRSFFLFVVGGFVLAVFGFRQWLKTERGRYLFDRFKLKIPIFGQLFHKTALSRFARNLGVLSRSGVPILQALDIVADTVNNALVAEAVRDMQEHVKQGESLAQPLQQHKVFPPMVVQMLSVGEETGALDTMLEKVAEFYDDEITAMVDSLTAMIEPVLIAIVGGVVGLIIIALYMPMFRIFDLIK
ncbi:MAG TPA: type II secretion system F family protein [Actinomycetota bacterium]|nr:type II secretion system F family protein [Actinomycetota bacterium]